VAALAVVALGCGETATSPLERPSNLELPTSSARERAPAALVWDGEQRLEASDAAELDQLGYAVSLGEGRALLGAPGDDAGRGAAYSFARRETSFTEEQKLVASDGGEDDAFGWSASLGVDRALLGAHGVDQYRGAAYVFARNESGFTEEQRLEASDGAAGDQFGWSLSLGEDRALVGASGDDGACGAAYVFVRSGDTWTEEQKLMASDGTAGDQFGWSVALLDDRAVIGALGDDMYRGAAYVFVRSGGTWTEEQKLVAADGAADDHFGSAVSLGENRVMVGAYWEDSLRGAVYGFVRNGDTWTEEQKLIASDGDAGHRFGNSVSVGEGRVAVGAYASAAGRGAAYVFSQEGTSWSEEAKLVASDGSSNDLFGWSVALAADRVLAGAYYDDNLRGAAYAFSLGLADGDGCAESADCANGHCVDGRCCDIDGDSPECAPCTAGDECTSGHCEDGVCCDRACAPSERCRADLKVSGGDGTCGPALVAALGAPCTHGEQCTSGHCVDGYCCNATCDGTCQACTRDSKGEGEDGTCGDVAEGTNPPKSDADPTPDCGENAACRGGECINEPSPSLPDDDSGCGCRAGGAEAGVSGYWLTAALVLFFIARVRHFCHRPALRFGRRLD
jgi:MYXO-CTERM domain-containing protein